MPVLQRLANVIRATFGKKVVKPLDAGAVTVPVSSVPPRQRVTEYDFTEYSKDVVSLDSVIEHLQPSHAGSVIRAEFWWSLIGNPNAFTKSGDASQFWSLVAALTQISEPLGFMKGVNPFTGLDESRPISDPMEICEQILARNREKKLGPVSAKDYTVSAKWLKTTPQSLADAENARRTDAAKKAVDAEQQSMRLIAAAYKDGGNEQYLIPKARCLSRMVETCQFSLSRIKDAQFREAEAILWDDEITRIKNLHEKATFDRASVAA